MNNRNLIWWLLLWLPVSLRAQTPPPLQLAETYQAGASLSGYWVSEKLDGVRAYWDGERLWSRQGHQYPAPAWFVEDFPDVPLDGELWLGRGRFSELSAAVRRFQPRRQEWQRIRYMVFDLPASRLPFGQRLQRLRALLTPSPSPHVALIDQSPATGHDALMARLDEVIAAGGEGLMLHHRDSRYRAGRSQALLKVKRHQDAEAVVIAHLPGQGKYQGMLGALLVERSDGRRFRLGTGFSDAERADPPAIGALVTYKYFGLTATGLPRFASYLRVRQPAPTGASVP